MPHKLLFGERVLALAQSRKVVIANRALQASLPGKPALPLDETLLVAASSSAASTQTPARGTSAPGLPKAVWRTSSAWEGFKDDFSL